MIQNTATPAGVLETVVLYSFPELASPYPWNQLFENENRKMWGRRENSRREVGYLPELSSRPATFMINLSDSNLFVCFSQK